MPAHINWRTFISARLLPRGHILTNKTRVYITIVASRMSSLTPYFAAIYGTVHRHPLLGTQNIRLSRKLMVLRSFTVPQGCSVTLKRFYNRPCMHSHYTTDRNWWALIDLNYRNTQVPAFTSQVGLSASLSAHKLGGACW